MDQNRERGERGEAAGARLLHTNFFFFLLLVSHSSLHLAESREVCPAGQIVIRVSTCRFSTAGDEEEEVREKSWRVTCEAMLKTEADYSYLGEPTTAMKLRKWGLIAVLVLYGVLLIVLLALYGSVNNDDDDASCQNGAIGSFTSAVSFTASQVGFAASLSSSGSLQLGAGTTIYKDLYVKDSVCPKMPDIEPVFDSSFVLTYIDGERGMPDITASWWLLP